MPYTENEYIEICKRQLEEKFSFGNGHGHNQKDLELLSNYIEEKEGVYISLSTLKRVWKNDFKQGPRLATLNALVGILDYSDWQDFKLRNKGAEEKRVPFSPRSRNPKTGLASKGRKMVWVGVALLILAVFLFFTVGGRTLWGIKGDVSIHGSVVFEVDKTLARGVPNTAIFNYDVSHVEADSFFIQQSWNPWRRERIDPEQKTISSIYYESGYHRARLIANDSVIAMQPIHILSDGWEPHAYHSTSDDQFVHFKGESFIDKGQLHLPEELVKRKLGSSKHFYTRISNSRKYGVSSDNFEFFTRVKVDKMVDTNCPWLTVLIVTEVHIFSVCLVLKGCENFGYYKMGEISRSGKSSDLSLSGVNVFDWQEIGIHVKDKEATITVNGRPAYFERFRKDFGNIMGLTYAFDGKGSIDHVMLSDANGNLAFEDDFER
ncbi:hypothetical protein [Ulvibacterium sp.]|uniref:hypothetical protein n=1 Tax=Ulvibacterium sp. TaxID=2665914 RepID=UPI003BAC7A50